MIETNFEHLDAPFAKVFDVPRPGMVLRPVIPFRPNTFEENQSVRYAQCRRLPSISAEDGPHFDLVLSERLTFLAQDLGTDVEAFEEFIRQFCADIFTNVCSRDPGILRFSHDPKRLSLDGYQSRRTYLGAPLIEAINGAPKPFFVADVETDSHSMDPSPPRVRLMEARFTNAGPSSCENPIIRMDFALETLLVLANRTVSAFKTDLFARAIADLEPLAFLQTVKRNIMPGVESFVDHMRALVFLGASESRSENATHYARSLAKNAGFLASVSGLPGGSFRLSVEPILRDSEERYPELRSREESISRFVLGLEREFFRLPEGVRSSR